jgi:8-oxo-dGTP pyrophosphatase MutT (NUDIX family)
MTAMSYLQRQLLAAVYPLTAPPAIAPWNQAELEGVPLPEPTQPAAVLVGLIPQADDAQVVLTRRNEQLRHHAGQVSFPGGRIESSDVSPAAAALREATEEIGLQPAQAQLLGYLDPLLTITGFRVLPTVVMIDPAFSPVPDPQEVAEVFTVPLSLLLDPARLDTMEVELGGRVRHVFQYRYTEQRIWGATASILYNLRQRLLATQENV